MPDFNELHEHARKLADLTEPGKQEPGLVTWTLFVGEEWKAIVELWRRQDDPDRRPDGTEIARYRPYQDPGGGPLEKADQITIDARQQVNIHESPESKRTRAAMCGDCGEKYELTGDPTENHRRAMRHQQVCARRAETDAEQARLINEFQNQPMQREFRERAAAALAEGADPAMMKLTGVPVFEDPETVRQRAIAAAALRELPAPELYDGTVEDLAAAITKTPRRWWQFWRWFERD